MEELAHPTAKGWERGFGGNFISAAKPGDCAIGAMNKDNLRVWIDCPNEPESRLEILLHLSADGVPRVVWRDHFHN